jgi:hypothetical protein
VGRIVIDLIGVQRADDAQLVGHAANVRQLFTDFEARLSVALKAEERRLTNELLPLQLGDRLAGSERHGDRLAVHGGQLRLGIECFEVRRPAGHAEKDHALGAGRPMRKANDFRSDALVLASVLCASERGAGTIA